MNREETFIHHLQKKVTKNFGKKINTATDCENLSISIQTITSKNISSQTLRRFYGLIPSTSKISYFTLDVLSIYCGFTDWGQFLKTFQEDELESFFGNSEQPGESYWSKSSELCKKLITSPELLLTTHQKLMGYPMARKFFLEHHPMRDLLGTVYTQYFLSYLKYNTNEEAKIFAYGFLFTSAFLTKNDELMSLFYLKLENTKLSDEVFVIPAGLKFGIMLLYADYTKNENLFNKTFLQMKKARKKYILASEKSVCSFEYSVLELLIFTDRKKEVLFLIENNTKQINSDNHYVPFERKQTHDEVWKILCAYAYQKLQDKEKTDAILKNVNLDKLGIGWKKYYSILYYFTKINHENTSNPSDFETLNNLISETHFLYFQNQIKEI